MSDQDRDIVDVMEQLRETWLGAVNTSVPGMITAYDSSTQLASVQPMVMTRRELPDGTVVAEAVAIITGVPVQWRGSVDGTYAETFPLGAGDTGLLVHTHASIDRWVAFGRASPMDPEDDRRHDQSDAVFIPGVRSKPRALSSTATDAWVIAAPKIRLGSNTANDPVVRRSDMQRFMTALGAVVDPSGACAALHAALAALVPTWPSGSSKTLTE